MATEAILRHRRDTAANWTSVNPVLEAGQLGFETDTRKCKLGDGATAWNSLSYAYDAAGDVAAHTGDATAAHAASAISNTPAGSIAATDVQAALNELDTEKQPLDATLTAFAALTIAADSLSIGTGADAFAQTPFAANKFPAKASTGALAAKDITDFGLSLVDDANAAAARSTLGLGTAATMASTAFDASGAADDAIVAHVGFADPHTQYQKESEKDAANGYAGLDASARLVAARMPALTGDVTTSAGAVETTIADAAVTLAKMANLAQDKIVGRETASTGVPEAITHTATARIVGASTSIENLRQRIGVWRFWEEFVNGYASTVYTNSLGGSGNVYIAPHGYYAHHQGSDCQGILTATTGSGSAGTDVGCVYGARAGMYLSDGSEFVFRISTNTATSQKVRFGLRSDAPATSADVVNGAYFELETGTSTNWYGCTAAASSRTKTTTGYSNSNTNVTWQWFRIKFVSGASGVIFSHYASGAWVDDLTITTNIPTSGVNRQCRFFLQAIGNGGTYRDIYCDGWGIPIPSAPPVPTA